VSECKSCGWLGGFHDVNCHAAHDKEVILCPAQTYRQTRDEPAEYCETEVEEYGDYCPAHEEDDRSDELYEAWKEARYED
jgi:hypothetical protein